MSIPSASRIQNARSINKTFLNLNEENLLTKCPFTLLQLQFCQLPKTINMKLPSEVLFSSISATTRRVGTKRKYKRTKFYGKAK